MKTQATALKVVILAITSTLVAWPVPPRVTGQIVLEDVLARSFDVAVTIAPVDLRIERIGDDFRFNSKGSLRGRARIEVEVTAPQPISQVTMELDSDLTVRSVQAEGTQATFTRSGWRLNITFSQALAPNTRVPITVEYEGQAYFLYNELVLVSEGTLYPVLVSPFGDYSANLARIALQITGPVATGMLVQHHPKALR